MTTQISNLKFQKGEMFRFVFRRFLPTVAMLAVSCSPAYINVKKNSLDVPLEARVPNSNPRTESFLEPVSSSASEDLPLAKSAQGSLTSNGYFVGLAISGGGSRSANFAAACMFQLERLGLLQKVQCISAVSGGSLTAAYYCITPDSKWNPQAVQDTLTHPFESDVIFRMFLPWNLIGLGLGTLNRSNALADELSDVVFTRNGRRLTFGDLRADRPRLLINCTDMQSGRPFIFDNSYFDLINSDLDKYSLGHAVAASSAVPAILQPMTLRDYSTSFRQYNHLVDGGVYDNLGVQELVNSYSAETHGDNNPYPNGAILVIIDAGVPINSRLGSKETLGGFENMLAGMNVSSAVLLNRASANTLADVVVMHSDGDYTTTKLRELIQKLRDEHYIEIRDQAGHLVRVVHLSLSQVAELSTMNFGNLVNGISTGYDIKRDDAYNLYKAAEIIFRRRFDKRLIPLVTELNHHTPAATETSGGKPGGDEGR